MTQEEIYNLALGALLLSRRVSDVDTDQNNEVDVLNTHWDVAFNMTLEDMDLDSTCNQEALELLDQDNEDYDDFTYIYRYPTNCAFFRRIKSTILKDVRSTRIPMRIAMFDDGVTNQKAIFTNEVEAIGEFLANDLPLSSLSYHACLCIAYKLAWLSASLATGKGADRLKKEIEEKYVITKAQAQAMDQRENFNFEDDDVQSEFSQARLD